MLGMAEGGIMVSGRFRLGCLTTSHLREGGPHWDEVIDWFQGVKVATKVAGKACHPSKQQSRSI